MTIKVIDISLGGKSSEFTFNFEIIDNDDSNIDGEEKPKSAEEEIEELLADPAIELTPEEAEIIETAVFKKYELQEFYKDIKIDKPAVKFVEVTKSGAIQLDFTNDMFVPKLTGTRRLNDTIEESEDSQIEIFDFIKLKAMLKVELEDNSDSEDDKKFSWNITDFSKSKIDLQMNFEDPLLISS